MIKQDVGINATSLTGDIVGARAALLFSVILLVVERYSLTSRCSRNVDADTLPRNRPSFQSPPCDKNNKLSKQSKICKQTPPLFTGNANQPISRCTKLFLA